MNRFENMKRQMAPAPEVLETLREAARPAPRFAYKRALALAACLLLVAAGAAGLWRWNPPPKELPTAPASDAPATSGETAAPKGEIQSVQLPTMLAGQKVTWEGTQSPDAPGLILFVEGVKPKGEIKLGYEGVTVGTLESGQRIQVKNEEVFNGTPDEKTAWVAANAGLFDFEPTLDIGGTVAFCSLEFEDDQGPRAIVYRLVVLSVE